MARLACFFLAAVLLLRRYGRSPALKLPLQNSSRPILRMRRRTPSRISRRPESLSTRRGGDYDRTMLYGAEVQIKLTR